MIGGAQKRYYKLTRNGQKKTQGWHTLLLKNQESS